MLIAILLENIFSISYKEESVYSNYSLKCSSKLSVIVFWIDTILWWKYPDALKKKKNENMIFYFQHNWIISQWKSWLNKEKNTTTFPLLPLKQPIQWSNITSFHTAET